MNDRTSNQESNHEKVLRGEVVNVTDKRLREMQTQAIASAKCGDYLGFHWHWAAVVNELIARRASDEKSDVCNAPMRVDPPLCLGKIGHDGNHHNHEYSWPRSGYPGRASLETDAR